MRSLTAHLQNLPTSPSFETATNLSILASQARTSLLSSATLSECLSQDRLFAYAYIRFASSLLSTIKNSSSLRPYTKDLLEETIDILITSLHAMKVELTGIERAYQKYGLESAQETGETPTAVTRGYIELFDAVASYFPNPRKGEDVDEISLLKGLVLVWAIHKCYLEARNNLKRSKEFVDTVPPKDTNRNTRPDPLQGQLVDRWDVGDVGMYVERLQGIVDEMAKRRVEGDSWVEDRLKCESVWKEVLGLEGRFWLEMLRQEGLYERDDVNEEPNEQEGREGWI